MPPSGRRSGRPQGTGYGDAKIQPPGAEVAKLNPPVRAARVGIQPLSTSPGRRTNTNPLRCRPRPAPLPSLLTPHTVAHVIPARGCTHDSASRTPSGAVARPGAVVGSEPGPVRRCGRTGSRGRTGLRTTARFLVHDRAARKRVRRVAVVTAAVKRLINSRAMADGSGTTGTSLVRKKSRFVVLKRGDQRLILP